MILTGTAVWDYLSSEQKRLAADGALLVEDRKLHPQEKLSDYSYLVFPFAKLYEGFLKQLFLDLGIITDQDYRSDHFRIGKALSPNLVRRLGERSAYGQVERRFGQMLANRLWQTWKEARNLVFHYFPHNYRALTLAHAEELIGKIQQTMGEAVQTTGVPISQHEL